MMPTKVRVARKRHRCHLCSLMITYSNPILRDYRDAEKRWAHKHCVMNRTIHEQQQEAEQAE